MNMSNDQSMQYKAKWLQLLIMTLRKSRQRTDLSIHLQMLTCVHAFVQTLRTLDTFVGKGEGWWQINKNARTRTTPLILHEGTRKQTFCDFREVFPAQFSKFILNIHKKLNKGIIKSLNLYQPHNPSHISLYGSNHYTLAAPLFRIASNRADNRPLLQGSSQHSWQNCSQAMARMAFRAGSVFHVL